MLKRDIVRSIAAELQLSQGQVQRIVQKTFEMITEALVREQRIELRGFGVFEIRVRAPRLGRNPRTNERVEVPRRAAVAFKAGKEMQQRVSSLRPDQIQKLLRKHLSRPPRGSNALPPAERPGGPQRPAERERLEH